MNPALNHQPLCRSLNRGFCRTSACLAAQIYNLLYRRFVIGRTSRFSRAVNRGTFVLPCVLLLTVAVPLLAQDDTSGQTNDISQAQLPAQVQDQTQTQTQPQTEDMSQTSEADQSDQPTSDNGTISTPDNNTPGSPPTDSRISGRDARSRRFRRQRNQNQNFGSSSTQTTNSNPLDFSNFRTIAERNIFDPNRYFRSPGSRPPATRSDSFSLVGTMSYEKGTFAFFSGSSSQYQKALKPAESIAGYKVTSISENSVKLVEGTNQIELRMGMQMRREEDGPWRVSSGSQSYAAAPASSPGTASDSSVPSGPSGDVLKRLMQRREQE